MVTLVTGGSGFIGSYILHELVDIGEEVISFSRRPPVVDLGAHVGFEGGDVRYMGRLLEVVKKHEVDRVIHTVSLLTRETQANPLIAFDVNIRSTLNILEVSRIMDVDRFVYISGSSVYGITESGLPVKEEHPRNPVTIYGAIKVLCEDLGMNYVRNHGLDWVGIRYPMVYGPKRERGFLFIQRVIVDAILKKHVKIPSGGDQRYAPVHAVDAARGAVLATFRKGLKHRIFNIGPEMDRMYTLYDIADIVKRYVPDATFDIGPGEVVEEPLRGPLDITRAKEELGYEVQYSSLEDGVREFIEMLRKKVRGGFSERI